MRSLIGTMFLCQLIIYLLLVVNSIQHAVPRAKQIENINNIISGTKASGGRDKQQSGPEVQVGGDFNGETMQSKPAGGNSEKVDTTQGETSSRSNKSKGLSGSTFTVGVTDIKDSTDLKSSGPNVIKFNFNSTLNEMKSEQSSAAAVSKKDTTSTDNAVFEQTNTAVGNIETRFEVNGSGNKKPSDTVIAAANKPQTDSMETEPNLLNNAESKQKKNSKSLLNAESQNSNNKNREVDHKSSNNSSGSNVILSSKSIEDMAVALKQISDSNNCSKQCSPFWLSALKLSVGKLDPNHHICTSGTYVSCSPAESVCATDPTKIVCCPISCLTPVKSCYKGPEPQNMCIPIDVTPWLEQLRSQGTQIVL